MPTYEYACKACSEHLEVVQKFSDEPLTNCPACGGALRKVFGAVGISFKGSGFYKTDSRGSAPKANGSSAKAEGSSEGGSSPTTTTTPSSSEKKAEPAASTGSAAAS